MLGTELALLLVDAVERAFGYALIALAARLILIATAPVRQAPEPLIGWSLPIVAALIAPAPAALVAARAPIPFQPAFWVLAAALFVAALAVLHSSHHGRVWRAMLVDVKALARIGVDLRAAIVIACVLALAMSCLAGAVAGEALPRSLMGWMPLMAVLILLAQRRLDLVIAGGVGLAMLEALFIAWTGDDRPLLPISLLLLFMTLWLGRQRGSAAETALE